MQSIVVHAVTGQYKLQDGRQPAAMKHLTPCLPLAVLLLLDITLRLLTICPSSGAREEVERLPEIYVVTPTYRRPAQLAELTRLSQVRDLYCALWDTIRVAIRV
jgi:hypothetical protein